ncbi:MFS transporter [Streptosporangium saharense]|uniref:MFS transporter n=1 Tax=Streptosporangium saharense TaxID=1706840 RepID=UPI00344A91D6
MRMRPRLGLLTTTHAVNDFYQGAVPVVLPFLVIERGYGYAAASGFTLAATFLSSLLQPAFGILADRVRRRWLIAVGMLVAGLGIGLSGVTGEYWLTWCAIAVSGIGVAAYHPEAARAARDASGGSARGMSWFSVGGTLGSAGAALVVAPVLGGTGLAGTPLLALPALVLAVVALPLLRSRPVSVEAVLPPVTGRDDWRAFGWLTAVVVVRSVIAYGIHSFLALLLISRFQVSDVAATLAVLAYTGTGVAGTLLGGRMADRLGRVTTVRIGLALCPPGAIGLMVAPNLGLALLAAVVVGLGVFIPFSVDVTLGQEYLPGRIGTASGVTLGLSVSAGGVVAPLLGLLADAHGLVTVFAVVACVPLAGLAVCRSLPETRSRKGSS